VSYQAEYSEVGKAHDRGKDLTEVRSLQRKLMPDRVGLGKHEPTSLQGIANRAKTSRDHRFQNLYRCLDVELLYHCWLDLHKDAASGVDKVTAEADEQDLEANLQNLGERRKNQPYHAKLVRRC
jgi:hypothetical protein